MMSARPVPRLPGAGGAGNARFLALSGDDVPKEPPGGSKSASPRESSVRSEGRMRGRTALASLGERPRRAACRRGPLFLTPPGEGPRMRRLTAEPQLIPTPPPAQPAQLEPNETRRETASGPVRRLARRLGWRLNLLLLLGTFATTTFCGSLLLGSSGGSPASIAAMFRQGLTYSIPVLLILGSHEMGHYVLCRIHRVQASLPYFIPAPWPFFTGTFGAVIRMRPPVPSRRALFDIGIAGPIAGFLVAIPVLVWGVVTARTAPALPGPSFNFGEPLLLTLLEALFRGDVP